MHRLGSGVERIGQCHYHFTIAAGTNGDSKVKGAVENDAALGLVRSPLLQER